MARRISEGLRRISNGWVTLAALAIFLAFTALVLPRQAASAEPNVEEAGSPDTSLFYTPDELYRTAEAYGAEGRAAYIRARLTFDVVWPLVYAFFLTTAIGWLAARAFDPDNVWSLANLAPVLGALLDFLENASTSLVMARYPAPTPVVVALAPIFTFLKWIFVGGSFGLLFVCLAVAVWRWRRKKGN